jgi:hypothetical protein
MRRMRKVRKERKKKKVEKGLNDEKGGRIVRDWKDKNNPKSEIVNENGEKTNSLKRCEKDGENDVQSEKRKGMKTVKIKSKEG